MGKIKYRIILTSALLITAMVIFSCGPSAPEQKTTSKKTVAAFDFSKISKPFDPSTVGKHDPTPEDISNFKEWISVYNSLCTSVRVSVKDTIMAAIGESDGAKVWDSLYTFGENVMRKAQVGPAVEKASGLKSAGVKQEDLIAALIGSYFPDITKWRYYEGGLAGYPYRSAVELWNHGFIVSLDMGGTWRLHSARDGSIVYAIENKDVVSNEAFSCVVSQGGKVYWQPGTDSCEELIKIFKLDDGKTIYAKVHIVPDNNKAYPYLYPDEPWKLVIDETTVPSWLTQEDKDAAWAAFSEWKKIVYQFDYAKALHPFNNPVAAKQHEPTTGDLANLKEWATVWNALKASNSSVGASATATVWKAVGSCIWNDAEASIEAGWRALHVACPGAVVCQGVEDHLGNKLEPSIRDAIGDSVGDGFYAYVAGYFTAVKDWEYYKGNTEGYPYQSTAELWAHGMMPSFDGTYWRLSSGPDAAVVLELTYDKLMKSN